MKWELSTPTANMPADIRGLCGGTICTISQVWFLKT